MATVADLSVAITADPTGLQHGLDQTKQMLQGLKTSVDASSKGIAGLGQTISTSLNEPVTASSRIFKQFTDAIGQVSPEAARMTQSVISGFESMGLATTLAATGITAVGAAIVKVAFDAAVEFDKASDRIRVATGAVGNDLKSLEGSFRNVFTSLPVSAEDAAKAISFLSARLQESGPGLEKLAATELELARITGSALGPQLEATTKLFKNWKISTDEQVGALDFLFRIGQQTALSVTALASSLVKLGPELKALGFSFQESAVLIGKFESEGISLDRMLPGLKASLKAMAKEGVTDASEAFKILIERIKDAPTDLAAVGIATKEFGRNGVEMADAIRSGRFELEAFKKQLEANTDTIAKAAQDTNDFAESWRILKNKITDALEPLGKLVFDALSAIISSFTEQGEQIKARWTKVWDDLMNGTREGSKGLIQIILDADDPASNAGRALADAIHDGFFAGWNRLIELFKSAPMPTDILKSAFEGFPAFVADVWNRVADSIIGPIQRALDWLKARAGDFKTAFDAITAAARAGLVVHSPPIAAMWVMEIGDAALESAGKVQSSASVFAAGFTSITEAAAAAKTAVFFTDEALNQLKEVLVDLPLPVAKFTDAVETAKTGIVAQGQALQAGIGYWRDWASALKISEDRQKTHNEELAKTNRTFQELSRDIPHAWNIIIDAIGRGLTSSVAAFQAFGIKAKGFAKDVVGVIDNMPGKWGDALRKTLNEVDKWINFLDSAIKLIQRLFGDQNPGGLGSILSGVVGIFKKTSTGINDTLKQTTGDIQDASADWSTALENMSKGTTTSMNTAAAGVQSGASKIIASLGSIAGAVLAFAGAKGQGFIGGAFSGALGGLAAAGGIANLLGLTLTPLTLGLSALGGALFGGILGLFGGGKSAAQKEQERLQLEQLKLNVQQTAQSVIDAAIQGFDAALKFFESLDEFTAPRKRKFAQFWLAMTRLMNGFLELSKLWATASLEQAKAVAENIKPVAETLAALPAAFDAINKHFGVAQSAIDRFFADFSKIMEAFFARADVWIEGVSKRAKKVAQRLAPAVALIADFGTALTNIKDIKEPPDEVFEIFDRVIDKILVHVTNLNLRFEKDVLKAMANFSEKAGFALTLWKTAIDSITGMVDIKMPSDQDFANIFNAIEKIVAGMSAMAARLETESLSKAEAIANSSLALFASIKAGVEALTALKDFQGVLPETFQTFLDDFNAAITMLESMAQRAIQFDVVSAVFKNYIASGAASLNQAFVMLSQIMNAAGSFFPGGSPAVVVGGDVTSTSLPSTVGATSTSTMGTTSRSTPTGPSAPTGSISLTLQLSGTDPRAAAVIAFIEQTFGAGVLSGTSSQFA